MRLRKSMLVTTMAVGLIGPAAIAVTPAEADSYAGAFQPVDPQNWENPDDMTWDDYRAVPNRTWNNPAQAGSVRNFKIALVLVDYPDQPFVVTQPAGSTIFGNPQPIAANLPRDQVAQFYTDFLNTPGELNHGRTIHEYWMEDSGGRYGVELTGFGPYTLPNKSYHYGITNDMNPGMCPTGETCNKNIRTDALAAWRAAEGQAVIDQYEQIFYLGAGQDESSTWQEFGMMKFNAKEDVPDAWGPPDPAMNNWSRTRYVEWTSWQAAASIWPNASGNSSTQAESSGMATYAHELSHLLGIADNYNNPYAIPVRRAYSGIWGMLSRGTFNGPGGPHTRWQIPATQGGSLGAQHMLRDKLKIGLVASDDVLRVSREALATSGMVVATVTARSAFAGEGLAGVNVTMDGDRSPGCSTATDPLCDGGNYNNYTVEVVDRMGADSFTPDRGVLLSKTKNADAPPFVWVVDAHPEDIDMVDYARPDGTPVKITMGDYRQLSDALFHSGTDSGSDYEYVDEANGLHFYVLNATRGGDGILRYTVAIRPLDRSTDPQTRGLQLGAGEVTAGKPTRKGATCTFDLTNTGQFGGMGNVPHPTDVSRYVKADVYRLSATVAGKGYRTWLPHEITTARFGQTTKVHVSVGATADAAGAGFVKLTATSESDPTKTMTRQCRVDKA
ncbi:M6 family metalloprotease domain-containing protein [Actinomycetes bacterium KLBMP 9797]